MRKRTQMQLRGGDMKVQAETEAKLREAHTLIAGLVHGAPDKPEVKP